MTMSNEQLVRVVLLIVCVALWVTALPVMSRGIVGSAFTRDLVSAGSFSVTLVFHTLSLILLGSMFERSGRSWL